MRRAVTAVGLTGTLLAGGTGVAIAATQKTPEKNRPCVSSAEFAEVDVGMSKATVASIFGTKGERESIGPDGHGYTNEVRQYSVCSAPAAVITVTFASGADLPGRKVGRANAKSWDEAWTQ